MTENPQTPDLTITRGIGYELKNAMSWGQGKFDEAAAIFILLFATIVAFDQLSSHVRNRLVGKGAH